MLQSRKLSLIEAVTNTAVGFGISLASQLVIFSAYGVTLPLIDNIAITCWFTGISIARGYLLRRAFNGAWRPATDQYWRGAPPPMAGPRWSERPPAPYDDLRERFDREGA